MNLEYLNWNSKPFPPPSLDERKQTSLKLPLKNQMLMPHRLHRSPPVDSEAAMLQEHDACVKRLL